MSAQYQNIKKSDLHIHLNGAIPNRCVMDIAHEIGLQIPADGCLISSPVPSLNAYFSPWEYSRQLPVGKAELFKMIGSVACELANDSVEYAELRNSVIYIANLCNIELECVINWFSEALDFYSERYGIDLRLIVSVRRDLNQINQYYSLLDIITNLTSTRIVGFDLTGNETTVKYEEWPLFFKEVKNRGLGVTIHAGENWSTENVRFAIECCGADRIGHGLAISKDKGLLSMCKDREVCIEVCLTSNYLTSSVRDLSEHPVITFYDRGIPFVICSDNPGIHGLKLSDEYELMSKILGTDNWLTDNLINQQKYAFKR